MGESMGAGGPMEELRFALAEGDAEAVGEELRTRLVHQALAARGPGRPLEAPEAISGLEAFRRAVGQMDALLASLADIDWRRRALRDLNVQELVGHLIAAEDAFWAGLRGPGQVPDGSQHVRSTQATAKAQAGRPPARTHADWRDRTARTAASCAGRSPAEVAEYYGTALPLDQVLVVRSFEIWAHHEDVRRATGRPPRAPDDAVLARMVQLAAALLPVVPDGRDSPTGDARAPEGEAVRLVLTGRAGGAWDMPSGRRASGTAGAPPAATVVVVDAADFCRVVANRADLAASGATVLGDRRRAEELFARAASLALD